MKLLATTRKAITKELYRIGDGMDAEQRRKYFKMVAWVLLAIFVLHALLAKDKAQVFVPPPPPVITQKPIAKPITNYVTQTGTVVAYNSVDLVARIEGYLEKIEFVDGTVVPKGKELFVVEPKPYWERLAAAKAMVVARKAAYGYSKVEYERQQRMYKQNATSMSNVQKWQADSEENYAEIDKAQADAEIAAINYSYTHIAAPFTGRVGRHLVDIGNLVGNGVATDLATIEQIDPIYVYFNLNELDLIRIRDAAKSHDFKPEQIDQVPVYVKLQNETEFVHVGKLNFVNTGLNASTGTLEFRALLPNKDFALLPGLFVQVRIPLSDPIKQLTIPGTAVQFDQIGPYVLVADPTNHVVLKRVETGREENGIYVILKGLTANDKVIVSGIQNATPGHLVTPQVNASQEKAAP